MDEYLNKIYLGDCLDRMKLIKKNSVDLIYLDPPFFTKKKHTLKTKDRTKQFSFDDIWSSDLIYGNFLYERIKLMKELLWETGSIFVHCDQNAQHIIRLILDHIFGENNFQSEIIWTYKRWSNSKKGLLSTHQNIYFYSRGKNFKFNSIYTDYSATTNIDQILQKRVRDKDNKSVYDQDENGKFKLGNEKKGVPLSDVWDIPFLNPKAKERVGYPTQKPLLLLERIIELVTNENDVILDPFCGSGTTCVAAKLLNRNFIGIDQSSEAVELSNIRLKKLIKTESNLLKKGRQSYINVDQEALSLLNGIKFYPVQRNKGIDAILVKQFENTPVLIRIQKNNETLIEAASYLLKAKEIKQAKIVILIQTNQNNFLKEYPSYEGLIIIQSPALQINQFLNI
jgi:site-specific DNA-methyltransferase (adenine-specific)